jgi:peroxiredoxin (alkyl hydroperoxide reductase subunit C)
LAVIAPGTAVPDIQLTDEQGERFTRENLLGQTSVLVFYPFAFSPVCTDQFQIYEEVLDEFEAQGAKLYGVSCDSMWSQKAFKEKLGITIPQLSDFEPKGETSRALGVYFEKGGMPTRALVIVDPEGVVQWSWEGEHPGVLPGANLIFDGLAAGASA